MGQRDGHREAGDALGVLLPVDRVPDRPDRRQLGVQRRRVGDRAWGEAGQRPVQRRVDDVVRLGREQRLAERGGVRGQPPPDRAVEPQRVHRLALGEVDDLRAVEPSEVDGLAEEPGQLVERPGGEAHQVVTVQIGRAAVTLATVYGRVRD
jgi:hypothetical protein